MLLASLFAGLAFNYTRLGNAHASAIPLGGRSFKISHGVVNVILLSAMIDINLMANLEKFAIFTDIFDETITGLSLRESAELSVVAVKKLSEDIGIV